MSDNRSFALSYAKDIVVARSYGDVPKQSPESVVEEVLFISNEFSKWLDSPGYRDRIRQAIKAAGLSDSIAGRFTVGDIDELYYDNACDMKQFIQALQQKVEEKCKG
jgi:hypothetical protein